MAVVTPGKPLLSAPLCRVHCEDSPAAAEAAIMLQVLRLAGSPLSQCAERYKGHSLLSARVMPSGIGLESLAAQLSKAWEAPSAVDAADVHQVCCIAGG